MVHTFVNGIKSVLNAIRKTSFLKKLIIANSTANHDQSKHCVSVKTSNQEEHYIFRLHLKDVK